MAFSRSSDSSRSAEGLTARLIGIGMNFAGDAETDAEIEPTLVQASIAGVDQDDLRVLAVLTTWLGVHHARINADRLVRLVGAQASARVRAYWASVAQWLAKDRRLARLVAGYSGDAIDLLAVGTAFQIGRKGEDERFSGSPLRVPAGTLRDRPADVLTPTELAERHRTYRNRVLMGPTWRADAWTVLEKAPDLSVAEVARRAGCSFATAWQVAQDFRLWRESAGGREGGLTRW